ncbi:SusC/RagA family TonB-linked outer membrane protein [Chitinophaga japonensis]|uniref:TonB-linked SusC/RagA family outer membrane protein n=1 Tax=Chitinophaga japonensis TaxID=104662 RepID=A0A562T438_CHIJA|nr:TonB-dependent receptor [Chitinophaga japonensis]TWI88299.1 TonB-linked SusC/RagA family outer membrane protein [Chitinophaga japonensis]
MKLLIRITVILSTLVMFFACSVYAGRAATQDLLDKRVTITVQSAEISAIITMLQRQTGIRFLYSPEVIRTDRKMALSANNEKLGVLLDKMLKPMAIGFKVIEDRILLYALDTAARSLSLFQEKVVTGTVRDEQGNPVPGVTVVVKGNAANGTVTSPEGRFRLQVADSAAVLVVSFIGYETQELPVSGRTAMDIRLKTASQSLQDVIVVGYGKQTRRNVTGAVSTIKAEAIKDLPVTSVDQKLTGQVAGVQVMQVTGTPGGSPVVRIRGAGSIGAGDDPLYVIDGFPITTNYNRYSNPLSLFSPNDIESITVLKDAAAAAIYGSRGANGVILITTKKAKAGASRLEVDVYTGIQQEYKRNRVKMMTAAEYAQWRTEHRQDMAAFTGQPFDPASVPAEYRNPDSLGAGTNWYDAMTRAAPIQSYNLTWSKGTEDLRVLLSGGYFNQQGIVRNTAFQRYSFRANIEGNVRKNILVGLNFSPTYNIRNLGETEGHFNSAILTQALLNSPLPPVRQPDGSFTPTVSSPDAFANANPVNMLENTTNKVNSVRALTNVYADWEIIPGLHFKSSLNIDYSNDKQNIFVPSYVGGFRSPPPQPATGAYNTTNLLNLLNENTLTWDKQWGAHNFSLLLGYTAQQERAEYGNFNGSQYPDDNVRTLNAAAVITGQTTVQEWRQLSYLGRINYEFKDRYLASLVFRRDGSSRFGANNRWGNFPSASLGWRISEEPFFPATGLIDDLKLRGSYGLAGNNNIGNYTYLPGVVIDNGGNFLNNTNYVFGSGLASGIRVNALANPDLGWESSRQMDIGIDLSLLKGRIYFIGEYYVRDTRDMLQTIDVPSVSGFQSGIANIGEVRNHGWEFSLSTHNFTKAFRWSTDLNISFNRNRIQNLGNKAQIISGSESTNISVVGQPMGLFYGYIFEGIFQSQEEVERSPHQAGQVAGTVKYRDVNGDGNITSADKTIMGNPYPDFTWGLTNRFNYRNFDLSILINGSQGAKVLDLYKRFTTNLDGVFNVEADVKHRWRSPEQPGNGLLPTTVASTPLAREINSLWVKDASYVAIRNVTLGYSFKLKAVNNVRVYFSAQNAWIFSSYRGNPEVNVNGSNSLAPGVNYTGYPVPATFTLGANLQL